MEIYIKIFSILLLFTLSQFLSITRNYFEYRLFSLFLMRTEGIEKKLSYFRFPLIQYTTYTRKNLEYFKMRNITSTYWSKRTFSSSPLNFFPFFVYKHLVSQSPTYSQQKSLLFDTYYKLYEILSMYTHTKVLFIMKRKKVLCIRFTILYSSESLLTDIKIIWT